jgi:glycosyltransferase involved in cell wall biosynthesis
MSVATETPAVPDALETGDRAQAVTVAYVHQNEVTYSWHHSMIEMVGWDLVNHGRIMAGGYIAMRCGSDGLVEARNKAIRHFLADQPADWLFWIDTDMGFEPDTIDRLLEAADPEKRPMVGGLCFSLRETEPDVAGGWRTAPTPTIFDWAKVNEEMGFAVRWDYPANTLTQCAGTGSACLLIHRSVLEAVEEKYGPIWYNRVPNTSTGQLISEDLSFCLRAQAIGTPLFVHTGVRTTHMKPSWVSEDDYRRQRLFDAPADVVMPPPATAETAVIVPAMRWKNAERFMASLRASTGLATAYAVADRARMEGQAAEAWRAAGATVIDADAHTFAERMNAGYQATSEPWLFVVGDDVQFHPGWLDQAQARAGDQFHVVGTNDLGNPRVMAGGHATHMLVRRSYVDEIGASWDGPKVLAHEGYRHWFVDDEIVTAAKQRGVWVMALESVVEHLHPLFGKGEPDDIYKIGESHAAQDRETFDRRLRDNPHAA